ncbi:helix-turn-helix domain-containing protein [Sulfuritalea sp.]|uniref:helix-turn-helix transcriptional regulator n=1 Tax=Sulfuritalea sp. TaxID=2480090 RepID=UPI001AD553A1|nr:helix-turn-helix domain-containing protein [Sulfuritalea sp.]MBN8474403.1 AlpA family phage regulatory protein [Sulfuritalea sp.]
MEKLATPQEAVYLRVNEVAALLGIAVSTVWTMAQDGRLPKSIRLGKKITVWCRHEVEAHIRKIDVSAPPPAAILRSPPKPQHPNIVAGQGAYWSEIRAGLRKHPRESDEAFAARKAKLAGAAPAPAAAALAA